MPELLASTAATLLARTARAQRDGRIPSLVAGVVRDGALVWSAGRGDVAEPHTDVQYRLGSISSRAGGGVLGRRDGRRRLHHVACRRGGEGAHRHPEHHQHHGRAVSHW